MVTPPSMISRIRQKEAVAVRGWYPLLLTGLLLLLATPGFAQRQRLLDRNAIGWYVYNGDYNLTKKWGIHAEYQWRRIDLIRSWQQSLARLGATYALSDRVSLAGGYTYFVTFPFGDYPQADLGIPYPEHRTHQDIQLQDSYGRLTLSHRFRLEQRWLAEQAETASTEGPVGRITSWTFQNRARYQVSGDLALHGPTIDDQEFYLNFFDELFIGFGQNVGENVFNQNRISGGLGYQFKNGFQLELNYLNQILQHAEPDPASGQSVFEINNGFRLNLNHTLDFSRK